MRIKIIIDTIKAEETGMHRSQVWEGELDILNEDEYLMMISVMVPGESHPIAQVPFGKGIGHYIWIPPDHSTIEMMGDYIETEDDYK